MTGFSNIDLEVIYITVKSEEAHDVIEEKKNEEKQSVVRPAP